MNTILLATDGSPSALKARQVAIELAAATSASLRIVSVWRTPVYDYGYVPLQYAPELVEAQRTLASEALEHAVAEATSAEVSVTPELREGDPADEICDAARAVAADLIVVGAHGWGPLKRLFFGSVSNAVLHHAPCPVLVVRGTAEAIDHEAADLHAVSSR